MENKINQFRPGYINFECHTSMLCSIHRIPESFGRDRILLKMFDETDEEAEKVWDTGSDMSWLRSSSLLKNWRIGKNSRSYRSILHVRDVTILYKPRWN